MKSKTQIASTRSNYNKVHIGIIIMLVIIIGVLLLNIKSLRDRLYFFQLRDETIYSIVSHDLSMFLEKSGQTFYNTPIAIISTKDPAPIDMIIYNKFDVEKEFIIEVNIDPSFKEYWDLFSSNFKEPYKIKIPPNISSTITTNIYLNKNEVKYIISPKFNINIKVDGKTYGSGEFKLIIVP